MALLESATKTLPEASTAMPRGKKKRATVPVPLLLPEVFVPATVMTSPLTKVETAARNTRRIE